jgi:hypothetical protein
LEWWLIFFERGQLRAVIVFVVLRLHFSARFAPIFRPAALTPRIIF